MSLSDDEAIGWLEMAAAASRPGKAGHLVGPPARSVGELFERDEKAKASQQAIF